MRGFEGEHTLLDDWDMLLCGNHLEKLSAPSHMSLKLQHICVVHQSYLDVGLDVSRWFCSKSQEFAFVKMSKVRVRSLKLGHALVVKCLHKRTWDIDWPIKGKAIFRIQVSCSME
jgi:hypothetical protein